MSNNNNAKTKAEPILPLVNVKKDEDLPEPKTIGLTLAVNPADIANSAKYKFKQRVLNGTEDLRTVLDWRKSASQCITGMGLQTGPSQYGFVKSIVENSALTLFETAATKGASEARSARALAAPANQRATIRASALEDEDN